MDLVEQMTFRTLWVIKELFNMNSGVLRKCSVTLDERAWSEISELG